MGYTFKVCHCRLCVERNDTKLKNTSTIQYHVKRHGLPLPPPPPKRRNIGEGMPAPELDPYPDHEPDPDLEVPAPGPDPDHEESGITESVVLARKLLTVVSSGNANRTAVVKVCKAFKDGVPLSVQGKEPDEIGSWL
jgi:hypothetical protein